MSDLKGLCFVIMPFTPELHYLYLYLKQHIETKHQLRCERADGEVRTVPVLDKINGFIREADVIIADCSGRNANVFYELGLAHAHTKQVILITKDSVAEAPSDIRHFEFIKYELDMHVAFLGRLDNALHHVLFEAYKPLHQHAVEIFDQFKRETKLLDLKQASRETFLTRVRAAEQTGAIPGKDQGSALIKFLLPKIIGETADHSVMQAIVLWSARQGGSLDG